MMQFNQQVDSESETTFGTCQHFQDAASALGINSGVCFGLSPEMDVEQLQSISDALQAAIEAEVQARALADRHVCTIGPYDGGICTICGGRQP